MRQHNAAFANFVCLFGDSPLLDYAHHIVLPAFLDDTLIRTYGDTTEFHFIDVSLIQLNDDTSEVSMGICGRFIKNTILSRTQIYQPNQGLIQDIRSIQSSPSAYFVLILNNHRLIYFPETPYAPEFKSFEATALQFLRIKHREFINAQFQHYKDEGSKITKKALRELHPSPTLEIVPLTGVEDIEEFVGRYSKLKTVELRLVKPNDDIDGAETFRALREYLDDANPKSTKIVTSNPDGLNQASAINIIHDASAAGNQEVKLSGIDVEGNRLEGNNEQFKLTVDIELIPQESDLLAKKLFATFKALMSSGMIRIDRPTEETAGRIAAFLRSLL